MLHFYRHIIQYLRVYQNYKLLRKREMICVSKMEHIAIETLPNTSFREYNHEQFSLCVIRFTPFESTTEVQGVHH